MRRGRAMRRSVLTLCAVALLAFPPSAARAQLLLGPARPPAEAWPRFVCEDGTCPAGVGVLLSFRASGEVGFCTATLIAPDRIVTAAHCLTSRAPEPMRFFLPDEHAVTVAWRAAIRVVHADVRQRGADHAIVQLDRAIDAPRAALARAEPRPDTSLELVRASPHPDRTVFLRRERCLVMPQALVADRIAPAAIVRIAGCTILPGNSGGPMLDERGRVVAVVSSGLAPAGVAVILAPWLTGPAPFVGTISSLMCLPGGLAPGAPPELCARMSRSPDRGLLSSAEVRDAATDAEREALAQRLIEWDRGDREHAIGWDLEHHVRDGRTLGVPVPGCIDLAELERTHRIDRRGRFALTVRVPAWRAMSFVGSDVRMVPITERVAQVRMQVSGRFDEHRERATIRIRVRGARVPDPRPRGQIPACRHD